MSVTFSDLHHRLGKLVEDRPGEAFRYHGNGKPLSTDKRHFDGLELDVTVRPTPIIDALLDERVASDPGFLDRCQAEWDAIDVDALLKAQRERRATPIDADRGEVDHG